MLHLRTSSLSLRNGNVLSPLVWVFILACGLCAQEGQAASVQDAPSLAKKPYQKKKASDYTSTKRAKAIRQVIARDNENVSVQGTRLANTVLSPSTR